MVMQEKVTLGLEVYSVLSTCQACMRFWDPSPKTKETNKETLTLAGLSSSFIPFLA
jgi:hypothetical protein